MKKIIVIAFAQVLALCLAACGGTPAATPAAPTPTPEASEAANPFMPFMTEFMEDKDMLIGDVLMKMDTYTYQQGQGKDYSSLIFDSQSPLTASDSELSEFIANVFHMRYEKTDVWSVEDDERDGSITKDADSYKVECTSKSENSNGDAVTLTQSATAAPDGASMDIYIYSKAEADSNKILTLWMQYQKTGGGYIAQYYFTQDGGETYMLLRYVLSEGNISYALFNDATMPSGILESADTSALFTGADTVVTYDGEKVVIQNGNDTLTL